MSKDKDELIAALERIERIAAMLGVVCNNQHQAFDEICELAKAQLEKLRAKQ